MAGKMRSLLDNLDQFVEVLALSRSDHVQDWDMLHVQRAFEWGTYFQHVHHRFMANKPLRNTIKAHLGAKNQELARCMKNYHHIGFDHLDKGRSILAVSLLQNNALPDPLLKYISERIQNSDHRAGDSICFSHVISQKAASELLSSLPLLASKELLEPLDNPVLITQAELLQSSLEGRLKVSEDDQKAFVVSEILDRIPKPHVYHLIVTILLSKEVLDTEQKKLLPDLFLDWVLSNNDRSVGLFMNVQCPVLAKLSFMSSKFRNVYWDHLVKIGKSMEQEVTCGKWVSNHFVLSFNELLDRYKHLMKGPEDVKDSVLTKLRTLQRQDGDYDVPGISIWTDVLIEIHQT
ncbi:Fanconi anemia group F protein [Engystomops pustulosus]|uniref:Fanconi anemia group F protein n=1 Tax=Engystomops pustulosus TaxID=76066 RepID=UPI003AFAD37B